MFSLKETTNLGGFGRESRKRRCVEKLNIDNIGAPHFYEVVSDVLIRVFHGGQMGPKKSKFAPPFGPRRATGIVRFTKGKPTIWPRGGLQRDFRERCKTGLPFGRLLEITFGALWATTDHFGEPKTANKPSRSPPEAPQMTPRRPPLTQTPSGPPLDSILGPI